MSNSLKRIGAIFIKELQDIGTNLNVMFMYILPLLMLFIYKTLIPDFPAAWSTSFALVMLVGEVGTLVPAMLIAEEKEKKTLEVLMLSPAKPVEIFAGKGLLTFVSILIFSVIVMLISGIPLAAYPVIILSTILTSITCIIFGMIIGLLSQNQMATGIIGLPIFLPFIMLPFLSFSGNEIILTINRFIPTYHYNVMITRSLGNGQGIAELLPFTGALLASILITLSLLLAVYKKKGFE